MFRHVLWFQKLQVSQHIESSSHVQGFEHIPQGYKGELPGGPGLSSMSHEAPSKTRAMYRRAGVFLFDSDIHGDLALQMVYIVADTWQGGVGFNKSLLKMGLWSWGFL